MIATRIGSVDRIAREQFQGQIRKPALWVGAFSLVYGALFLLQQAWFVQKLGFTPINIAAGLAVGAVAAAPLNARLPILGAQFILGAVIGAFVVDTIALAAIESLIMVLVSMCGAWLLLSTVPQRISRWDGMAVIVGVAAVVATMGATLLAAAVSGLSSAGFGDAWGEAWVGIAAGVVLLTPAAIAFRFNSKAPRASLPEFAAAAAITVCVLTLVFSATFSGGWGAQYLLIPLLLWFAVRFGLGVCALVSTTVNVVAIAATVDGIGPFAQHGLNEVGSLLTLELAMVLAGIAIYLAAVAEEQRRSSDQRLRDARGLVDSLLENSDAMISIREYRDGDAGVYTLANPRFAQAAGRKVRDIIGRTEVELSSSTEAMRVLKEDRAVLASQRAQVFVTRPEVPKINGVADSRVYLITKFPVNRGDGESNAVGSIALDITEHRRREQLMRLTFDQSPVPMARLAWRDGRSAEVLDANLSLGKLLGVPVSSLTGRSLDRFLHVDERSIALVPPEGGFGQPRRREARLVGPHNADLWVSVTATIVEPMLEDGALERHDEAFALIVLEDVTARRVAEHTLTQQALHDALTGVLNRYALIDRLESALSRLWRDTAYIAVLFCDLDGFKNLNDTLGHRAGDQLLVSVSQRLRAVMRPQDTVARLGGDEFVMVCEDLPTPGQARVIAERIREAMRAPFTVDDRHYGITVSVGIATTTDPHTRTEDLLRRADLAMYRAKDNGRNRVEYYVEELETRVVAGVEATEALRSAISEDRICVHYQPIVDLRSSRIVGVEALCRLIDKNGALVQPVEFIGVAESSGLVSPMGERVLDIALDQLSTWAGAGLDVQMNVNVSPRQLARASFAPAVFERMVSRGLAPKSLCLEVTEGAVVDATGPTLITLRRLRSYGVHVGMDDFGTGYSSLTTLKYLPADVLKVDRTFVEGLGEDPNDAAIVGAVVRVAHDLGRLVVAEGVETAAQAEILATMGCDQVQGFRYGRPVPADEITRLLTADAIINIPIDLTDGPSSTHS